MKHCYISSIYRKDQSLLFIMYHARTWGRRKKIKTSMACPSLCSFGHCSLRGGLLRYTTRVAIESPIIVCSHQNDRSMENAEDALPRTEKLFVAELGG